MKNRLISICSILIILFSGVLTIAKTSVSTNRDSKSTKPVGRNNQTLCLPPTSKVYLDINNVRAMVMNGGDMWWNTTDAQYEVPKGGGIHAIFAGSVWIGGLDAGMNLKLAAMTYRQNGLDFWPGPLTDEQTTGSADITRAECLSWNKHFKTSKTKINEYISAYQSGAVDSGTYIVPAEIKNWPAHGDITIGQAQFLAPYKNVNGNDDGVYDPASGDYPDIRGDQAIWWVINDKGNVHGESGADPIGIEMQIMAFGFSMANELNDATFYQYKLFNRSSNQLNKTYIAQWIDPDLGNYLDDYVGCNVSRGLGFCYNGDGDDETTTTLGYGTTPPALGVDFFKGPKADSNDGIDNDRDGYTDEVDEQIIMSNFLYYDNTQSTVNGNPASAMHFYNYMRNLWGTGAPCRYDYADGTTTDSNFVATNFMFPGSSDSTGQWTGVPGSTDPWDEATAGNPPGDRRFLESAGPFTLVPGQVIDLTIGVLWARAISGDQLSSLQALLDADELAQSLFETNFQLASDFSFDGACGSPTLTFTDLSIGNPVSWKWEFGDSTISTEQNPIHTFPGLNTYNVKLQITDANSNTVWIYKKVTVTGAAPTAGYTSVTSECQNISVTFTNTSTGTATKYQWIYNDTLISSTQNTSYTFSTSGQKSVTLFVYNGSCKDSMTQVIDILPEPRFTLIDTVKMCKDDTVNVIAYGNNIIDYSWSEGTNVGIDTDSMLTLFYPTFTGTGVATASYTATLTGTNTCKSTKPLIALVYSDPPQAGFDYSYNKLVVSFSDTSTISPYSIYWDFGDGDTTMNNPNPIHTYPQNGNYTVKLKVINGCGSDSLSRVIAVDSLTTSISPKPVNLVNNLDLKALPNISENDLMIKYTLPNHSHLNLSLFDLSGKKSFELENTTKNSGEYSTTISLKELKNGVYLLRLKTDQGIKVLKIIKM